MASRSLVVFLLFFALSTVYGQSGLCDTAYWNHTYDNARLKIYDSCYTITATVQNFIPPALNGDGDYHIYMQPDTQYAWMLSYRDSAYSALCEGVDSTLYQICPTCLNVEEICKGPITDTGAGGAEQNAACLNFNDTVYLPNIGEYVQATGPFIYDKVHCWNELHPISRMILLRANGVSEAAADSIADGLKVFPVPADKQISFRFDHAPHAVTLIKLYDISGRQLYVYALAETSLLQVDVSLWTPGQYLYSIVAQEQNKVLRSGEFGVLH